jgi:hypothetical protein
MASRDELLGRLLAVPLDRFVEQRNRLSRELRDAGDRETATWLASLRRPAPGIWALDQLARGDRRTLQALLDLSDELGAVQAATVRGDRDGAQRLREVSGLLQRTIDDAVRRAVELLRDAGHGVAVDTQLGMAATLRAALAGDAATRADLAAGRLLAPVEMGEGFGFGFGAQRGATVPADAGAAGAGQAAGHRAGVRRTHAEQRGTAAKAARGDPAHREGLLRQLREQAAATARAAEAADRDLSRRRADAERDDAHVVALREQLHVLQAELNDAQERAAAATRALRDAEQRARSARSAADRADAALPVDPRATA